MRSQLTLNSWWTSVAIASFAVLAFPVPTHADTADLIARLIETRQCIRCRLNNVNLSGLDLSGVNLTSAFLISADLSNTNLYRANLSNAVLNGANLSGANLSLANLRNASLHSVRIERPANFSGANFDGTIMPNGVPFRPQPSPSISPTPAGY